MMELKQITERENKEFIDLCSDSDRKFASKAFSLWKRFGMFEKNAPYALVQNGRIYGICHITVSPKRKYANLYYIQMFNRTRMHKRPIEFSGTAFYQTIVEELQKQGIERIKLSSEYEAIRFWLKQGFWFWAFDKTGSLKADAPLLKMDDLVKLREQVISEPKNFLPSEKIKLPEFSDMKEKTIGLVEKCIGVAQSNYIPYVRWANVESTLEGLLE